MSSKKIVVFHMRDDLSGSTRVLAHSLEVLSGQGFAIDLYAVCLDYPGFLSSLQNVNRRSFPYRRYNSRLWTFLAYLRAQAWLFFAMWRYRKQPVTVYINTVLPFGPALAAWLMRKRVVYHIHETSLAPAPAWLRYFLFKLVSLCAKDVIHVSKFLETKRHIRQAKNHVIYNSVASVFSRQALRHRANEAPSNNVPSILMVCSLAPYKGIEEFRGLARQLPEFRFQLVLNATQKEFEHIYVLEDWPSNVEVFYCQEDVHPFYQQATVLVNLSLPGIVEETFGMTVLEAMTYGLPVIVPPVGGVVELVEEGQNGYRIDARDTHRLVGALERLCNDAELYQRMSANAIKKCQSFSSKSFAEGISLVYASSSEPEQVHA